jgi:hypothetical protein
LSTRLYIRTPTRSLVSLLVCFALSLVLIVGSVSPSVTFSSSFSSSSFTLLTKAFAGGDSGSGDHDQGAESGDGGSGGSGGSASPESGDGGSGGSGGSASPESGDGGDEGGSNKKNDKKPTSEDSDTGASAAKKIECPKGQEVSLFSTSCKPVGGTESPGNTGATISTSTPTTCPSAQFPDRSQLGKKYDPSSILSTENSCNINQLRNPDGSITATITRPDDPFKDVIKTDTTGKVVVQENRYDNNDKLRTSAAIDNNRISTRVQYDDGGPGKNSIDITEHDGTQVSLVWWKPGDGSVQRIVSEGIQHDDDDNDPTTATSHYGMKTTVRPFNARDPYYIDVRNPDGSLKTQLYLHSDGTVEPGSKWTTPAPVEPANK